MQKICFLFSFLCCTFILAGMDNSGKNASKIQLEKIKLYPQYPSDAYKTYRISSSKREADSLGVIQLKDTLSATVRIRRVAKMNNKIILEWQFSDLYIDTSVMELLPKINAIALVKTLNTLPLKISLDEYSAFEVANEDELLEAMQKNNPQKEELKEKVRSKSKKESTTELADLMFEIAQAKYLEKSFYKLFTTYTTLYGFTYIQDSLIPVADLKKQEPEESEDDDAFSKLLGETTENMLKIEGGAELKKTNGELLISYRSYADMSELMNSMAGLFGNFMGAFATGMAEAFQEEDSEKKITAEDKEKINSELSNMMKEMKMARTESLSANYEEATHLLRKLDHLIIIDGFADGKPQYEADVVVFEEVR